MVAMLLFYYHWRSLNKNKVFRKCYNRHVILRILRIVNIKSGLVLKRNKVGRGIKQVNKYAHKKNRLYKNFNERALAITPDDSPMRSKHVVVE
jgi:hypothetical protein